MINYTFDSEDEKLFYNWLEELLALDLVEIKPDRETFSLNDPLTVKITTIGKDKKKSLREENKSLLKTKTYTPDFIFKFKHDSLSYSVNSSSINQSLTPLFTSSDGWCYVDVKGAFTRNLSSSMTFPDRQVMMYQKHGIYVNKVICHNSKDTNTKGSCLFKTTFVPDSFIGFSLRKRNGKNGEIIGESKIKYDIKTIKDFVTLINKT